MSAPLTALCTCTVRPKNGGMDWSPKCPMIGHRTLATLPYIGPHCRICDKPLQSKAELMACLEESSAELQAIVADLHTPATPLERQLLDQHATTIRCSVAQLAGYCSPVHALKQ